MQSESKRVIILNEGELVSTRDMFEANLIIKKTNKDFRVIKNRHGSVGKAIPIEQINNFINGDKSV